MILFKKKILFVGALVIGGIFFSSCGGQETTSTTVEAYNPKITMDPKKGEIGLDGKITLTLSPKNKAASIYYEIVKGNAEPTITKENFASYTKYSKFVAAKEADFGTEGTIYAVAVKDGVAVSDITKATFKPRDLETYVLPSGATGDVPAWTKSNDGVQNLPDLKLHGESSNVTPELLAALETAKADDTFFKQPKNYILMMGDGMGVSQIVAATQLRGPLLMNQLPYKAVACSFTRDVSDFTGEVTDSGAGGTKLATGYRTTKLFAGIDAEGNELLNLS